MNTTMPIHVPHKWHANGDLKLLILLSLLLGALAVMLAGCASSYKGAYATLDAMARLEIAANRALIQFDTGKQEEIVDRALKAGDISLGREELSAYRTKRGKVTTSLEILSTTIQAARELIPTAEHGLSSKSDINTLIATLVKAAANLQAELADLGVLGLKP